MPTKKSFLEDIDWLRSQAAKHIFLKTGAYRPSAVDYTMKLASEAEIDAVTFDGAGGCDKKEAENMGGYKDRFSLELFKEILVSCHFSN